MKIRKVWAMYFSPTGTTEKTVTALASEIAEMTGAGTPYIFDFTLPDARKSFPEINCGEGMISGILIGIVAWMVLGRLPHLKV